MTITTWQQAVDFTFQTRSTWKGKEAIGPGINCRHFTEFFGDGLCSDITRKVLKTYGFHLEEQELSDATINRCMSAISTVLNHCVEEEELDINLPKVPHRKEYQGRPFFFSKDEVDAICRSSTYTGLSDLVRAASLTGARMGELLSLTARDIDLDAGLIYIGGRPGFKTKNGDWRTVPIHSSLETILRERLEGTADDVLIFGDQWLNGKQVLHQFKKTTRQLGLEKHFVFHSLRHSFATWSVEAGVPIRVLMDLLGHKKIETTCRYGKTTDKARTDAILSLTI